MLKKSITYTNPFTDQEVTEEHYFHLSKADMVEMQMESLHEPEVLDPATGEKLEGFRAKLQRIINSKDGVAVLEVVKDMIRRTYLRRDGDNSVKNAEITKEFVSTEAFSQLLFDLCTDAEAQADFMNGVMPKNLEQEAAKIAARAAAAENVTNDASSTQFQAPEPKLLTRAEMIEMSNDELTSGLTEGRYKLS